MTEPATKPCVECGSAIHDTRHQDWKTARVCSPRCAKTLLRKEHPELCGSERLPRDVMKLPLDSSKRKTQERISLRMLNPTAGRFTDEAPLECGAMCEASR